MKGAMRLAVWIMVTALAGCSAENGVSTSSPGAEAGNPADPGWGLDGGTGRTPDAGRISDAARAVEPHDEDDSGPFDEDAACRLSGGCNVPAAGGAHRVDLLFVVDNSGSMEQEQEALRREFPRLIRKLTTGDHDEDGEAEAVPVRDLHLGVISTDMGLPVVGISVDPERRCDGYGDDGRLLSAPNPAGASQLQCRAPYPRFLHYDEEADHDMEQIADDFACMSTLGTSGCGFEQPLEAALKALWPSADNRIAFLAATAADSLGHGDTVNEGFLRNGPRATASTLAIVVVSDEEDCSSKTNDHFRTEGVTATGELLSEQPANLRCFHNKQNLYNLERYWNGYRELRGEGGGRVVFVGIVGVPVDLVDEPALAEVDFSDSVARDAHYDKILNDPRMQEVVDDTGQNVRPSCETDLGKAYPPRRIVELAKQFGQDSLIQSICGNNFAPPIDLVVEKIVERIL